MTTPANDYDTELIAFTCDVAKALMPVASRKLWYGEIYVTKVTFAFDGDDMDLTLVANDHNSFDVRVVPK